MTKRAIVSINLNVLAETLFGKGASIVHARPTFNGYGTEVIDVVLEHPDLKDVELGLMLPRVTPILTKHEDGSITARFEDI